MRNPLQLRRVEYLQVPQQPRAIARPPEFGALSTTDAHPAVVARTAEEVVNGFIGQQIRLQAGNRLVCVAAAAGIDPSFPFAHPVLHVSTSVREYQAWPDSLDLDFLPAVALAADRQWIDRMIVLRDGDDARRMAAGAQARFALVWSEQGMQVLEVATGQIVRTFTARTRELTYRCCPLIPDAAPGDRCRMYGGGSVSRAIVAAGHWLDRRFLFLEDLGCDESCAAASPRRDVRVPTRYYKWLSEREIANEWSGIVGLARAEPDAIN